MPAWHAELAWLPADLGGLQRDVLIEVEGDRVSAVTPAADPPEECVRLSGLVLPGLVNAHSHAFQRALRGRTQGGGRGSFWTWREQMYRLAGGLDPDAVHELATAAYGEMALAGITAVGEFHYLHHGPDGTSYDDPNEMGCAVLAAAAEAGVRITLLDACYLRGGLGGGPLEGAQRRFGDASAEAWAERAGLLTGGPTVRIGAAVHSVRAVDERSIELVARWAAERRAPLHVHVSEQPRENQECLRATGLTPSGLLARAGALGPHATAVHATHVTPPDANLLGGSSTAVCLCPTTERDLADGIAPAAWLSAAGSPLCLGSDSHAVIDLFEEARAVELDERLGTGRRGRHAPETLLHAATDAGADALGWEAGELRPGRLADFIALDLRSVRLAGWTEADLMAQSVFAATAADVTDVVAGGRRVVAGGRHLALGEVAALLHKAVTRALALADRA